MAHRRQRIRQPELLPALRRLERALKRLRREVERLREMGPRRRARPRRRGAKARRPPSNGGLRYLFVPPGNGAVATLSPLA